MAVVLFIFVICVGGLMYLLPGAISLRNTRRHAATKASVPAGYPREKGIAVDYSDVLPPSRAHIISPPSTLQSSPIQASSITSNPASSATQMLKISDNYRTADPSTYIFSGFTIGQVRALGCFPDYATLSGVPLPSPLKDFRIESAAPRPYRPFRWPYHQTMSFQKMDPNYWLELECTYRERIAQRRALVSKNGDDVMRCMPGSELACRELMEMAIQFLCARYPSHFKLDGGGTLTNRILNTQHNLGQEAPLEVLVNNVPEDFGIMLRDENTGRYHLRAGVICSSLGWNLGEKIGRGLGAIHQPVPKYREKMEFSVDRFFTKLAAENPVQRGSWSLEVGQPLYMPSDDPHMRLRESQDPAIRSEDVFLRVDWQTLRRLPVSGAIVFNFKALFTPIAALEKEPYIPSLLHKVLSDSDESLLKYKGSWHVEHIAKPTLKKFEQTQIEQGLVEADWAAGTLDESPFYPGWQSEVVSS